MEKSLYKLCVEVFKILDREKILDKLILIGSWCIPFYKDHFNLPEYPILRTRDIDFLIPTSKIVGESNLPKAFKKLGFVDKDCCTFEGKYITKLQRPELIIEFLIPEIGKGSGGKPCNIPQLSISAQPLRFLNMLTKNTITVNIEGFVITLPHPAYFGIHKLIVAMRRKNEVKQKNDIKSAISVLKRVIENNEEHLILQAYMGCFKKSQKKIKSLLQSEKQFAILTLLKAKLERN